MTVRLEICPGPEEVARAAADRCAALAERALATRGRFLLALSGGSTPRLFHTRLAERHGSRLDWSRVELLWSDERAVGPEHESSNYRMAEESLLSRLPVRPLVHRIQADDGDHQRAAQQYDGLLARLGPVDLVILGMGEDGHTASLFPGPTLPAELARVERVIACGAPAGSPVARRVSFSYRALAEAREVLVLATGSGKATRLRQVLDGDRSLPMAHVLRARAETYWLIDQAAAAALTPAERNEGRASMAIDKADFGVIGLGVMGENLALNIEEKGFSIAVYNRSREKTDELLAQNAGKRVVGAFTLEELTQRLRRPRRLLIMVKAGAAVDQTIAALLPHLEPGDVVIDGGNELFIHSERRAKELAARGIHFVGMGVSGGEEGARHGPSLMPGGAREAYAAIEDVVVRIAAQVSDGPCVTHVGPGGAGHYVKMVHNGIEYGDMQLIAETYDVLKHLGGLGNAELAQVFGEWNQGELESFLIEITAKIFRQKDPLGPGELVDAILDTAQMKGTGSWTVKEGAELMMPIPTIASSVEAREMSALHALRQRGAALLRGPAPRAVPAAERAGIVADARAALYAAKACSYAQGLGLLTKAAATYGWDLRLGEIARIWKGGCIIRAAFLGRIQAAYARDNALENLLFDPSFQEELAARQDGWRRTVVRAVQAGVAAPTLTASLAYYDALRRARLPMNLTQAQRDLFGAHTYQRVDRPGSFHTEWGA